jgi:restriction system protein
MPIPDYQACFAPLLELAVKGSVTRSSATETLSDRFALSPDERQQRIPSGSTTYIRNRVGWAMTYLTKAGLIEKVAPKTYAATGEGREFLRRHPNGFGIKQLAAIPEFKAFHQAGSAELLDDEGAPPSVSAGTPFEQIDRAIEEINAELRSRLLKELIQKPPEFFEQVVLDVLQAMGYGGSRENAAQRLGGVGDEGVDGRINQDALGLDVVFVQAKRYAPENVVGREKMQQFVGALHGQGASKGIFITTSRFAATVDEFVSRGSSLKVVLIDGEKLTRLMLQHRVGVRVERHADVLALDNNYFDEE